MRRLQSLGGGLACVFILGFELLLSEQLVTPPSSTFHLQTLVLGQMFVEISPALCPCSFQADTFLFLCCRFSGLWGRGGGAECGWASPSLKQNSKVIFVQQTGKSQWLGHRWHWHTRWLLAKYENWMNSRRIHDWRAMKYDVCWTTDLSGHQTPKIKSLSNEQVNKEEKKKKEKGRKEGHTHVMCSYFYLPSLQMDTWP